MTLRPVLRRLAALVLVLAALGAVGPSGAIAKDDDRGEARIERTGRCGSVAIWRLRARADDGRIRVDLWLERRSRSAPTSWRLAVLHERRLVRRVRLSGPPGSRTLRRREWLPDLDGPDALVLRATGPRGETCQAAATLP